MTLISHLQICSKNESPIDFQNKKIDISLPQFSHSPAIHRLAHDAPGTCSTFRRCTRQVAEHRLKDRSGAEAEGNFQKSNDN